MPEPRSDPLSAQYTAAPLPPTERHARLAWLTPAFFLAALALLLSLGLAWHAQERAQTLEVQLARRIGEFDSSTRDARVAAKEAQAVMNDMRARLAAMEGQAQETQNQQLALAAMYQELARGQDERVAADVEQTLLLARQQLQLAGNIRAAILGLEAAASRLAALNKPQFEQLRLAIARDVERLRLLPGADLASLNARLEVLAQNVDKLKLDQGPAAAPAARATPVDKPTGRLERMALDAWDEVRQLVRIRRLDQPEAPLLTPDQTWFLRQNLKLRLLSARIAAFQRDQATFRQDIGAARDWVLRYFARGDTLTASMLESLQGLMGASVSQNDADLTDSLKALRAYRDGAHG